MPGQPPSTSLRIDALHELRTTELGGLSALVAAAFGFGKLHALLPGHGKAVLTSYYAGDGLGPGDWSMLLLLPCKPLPDYPAAGAIRDRRT
ncbi:MAG: hypothetical protein ACRECP_02525 [Methylocella sp.]